MHLSVRWEVLDCCQYTQNPTDIFPISAVIMPPVTITTVQLQRASYTVGEEAGEVEICTIVSNIEKQSFNVTINLISGVAQGNAQSV